MSLRVTGVQPERSTAAAPSLLVWVTVNVAVAVSTLPPTTWALTSQVIPPVWPSMRVMDPSVQSETVTGSNGVPDRVSSVSPAGYFRVPSTWALTSQVIPPVWPSMGVMDPSVQSETVTASNGVPDRVSSVSPAGYFRVPSTWALTSQVIPPVWPSMGVM